MAFHTYNVRAHNQMLGQIRSDNARRRNDDFLTRLRGLTVIPTERTALYAAVNSHSGKIPWSVLRRLAKQVRTERAQ
jgi:hypothetical protein